MGKTALAKYRAEKKLALARVRSHRRGPRSLIVPKLAAAILTSRQRTRVIAALIHGVDPMTISRDQRVARWLVLEVARAERI